MNIYLRNKSKLIDRNSALLIGMFYNIQMSNIFCKFDFIFFIFIFLHLYHIYYEIAKNEQLRSR